MIEEGVGLGRDGGTAARLDRLWRIINWRQLLPPLFLLLLGVFFRFPELGTVRHGYDQSYQMYDALRLLDAGRWTLLGQPSSVFLDNPPLMLYLEALPLLLWRSPWAVYVFVTVLNTAAIWFVYDTGRALGMRLVGFVAAFLFAVSPWVVHFSRLPWAQGLLPFFLSVAAWGLWPALAAEKRAPKRVLAGLLAVTAMMLSYILAFAFLAPLALLLIFFYRRLPSRALLVAGVVFLVGLALFVVGLLGAPERNQGKLTAFLKTNALQLNEEAAKHALRLVNGLDYNGQDLYDERDTEPSLLTRMAAYFLGLAILTGLARAVWALRKAGRGRTIGATLLIWFLTPLLGFSLLPIPVHPHYLLLTLPAGHFLAAWPVALLLRPSRWRPAVALALLVVAVPFRLNLYAAGEATLARASVAGLSALPLNEAARVGEQIRAMTAGVPAPRCVYAEADAVVLSGMSATLLEVNKDLSYPDFVLLPGQQPFLYLLLNHADGLEAVEPQKETDTEAALMLADGARVSFLHVFPYSWEAGMSLPNHLVDWASDAGLSLLGYTLEGGPLTAGGSLMVTTYWRVHELHPQRGEWYVTPFYHVVNDGAQIVANVSGKGVWGYRWQLGDVYVQRVVIPLPASLAPGTYRLALGLFDAVHPDQRFALQAPGGGVGAFEMVMALE